MCNITVPRSSAPPPELTIAGPSTQAEAGEYSLQQGVCVIRRATALLPWSDSSWSIGRIDVIREPTGSWDREGVEFDRCDKRCWSLRYVNP